MKLRQDAPCDEDAALVALRKLVAEIAADDYRRDAAGAYRAKIGSPLTNNTAYLEAVALLELREALERRG